MTVSAPDLMARLMELVDKVTPVLWGVEGSGVGDPATDKAWVIGPRYRDRRTGALVPEEAAYIALCSPDNIKSLLTHIQGLEKERDRANELLASDELLERTVLSAIAIDKMTGEIAEVKARAEAAERDRDAAREALKPFADAYDAHLEEHHVAMSVGGYVPLDDDFPIDGVPLKHFERARRVLNPEKTHGPE